MWLVYALLASLLWGVSYAAAGRVLGRGLSPLGYYACYLAFGTLCVGGFFLLSGRIARFAGELRGLGQDWIWFAVSVAAAPAAGLLIFTAISEKNAPVAALIEISYPLGAAFFTWLFFRESHLNLQTAIGAALIYSGIIVVALGNRG
ncbi:MAG: EamA family transporter [Verrucomicrobia bacterium]|jgi:drug/metabolite transporter (DMT)-like permease|nr:EamA family transporter [Verrucomicrobiota bacterium]